MLHNSRQNPLQNSSTIEKLRASYLPQMPFPIKNTTTVLLNGEVEKSQETFKAELNNISSLIQTLEKNPQDLELRAQISTRLTNAVSTAASSIPLADCERMMQNYGIRTYWEDMKTGKATLTDQNKDLNQAQLHQEQQAVLTAQQIAQIKQQAINDYNKTWKNHNDFDYAHATAAAREKWMQDELKKMPQWAQELGQIAKTKPFNEAKIEIQEQLRQKLKDIEEKKKEMLAVKNDPHATEEDKRKADRHLQLYRQEEKNIRVCQQNVANSKTGAGLFAATDYLRECSENLNAINVNDSQNNNVIESSEQQAKSTTAYLKKADNNDRINGTAICATAQSLNDLQNNSVINKSSGKKATSFAQASFQENSDLTINSERSATSFAKAQTSNSTPDAQEIASLLSALKNMPNEDKNENSVMSSAAEKKNTPSTSDKLKEMSWTAILKSIDTPKAPEVNKNTASAEQPVVQAPTLPNEQKEASAEQTVQNATPQNAESVSHTVSEPNVVEAPNKPTDLSALLAASSGKPGTENQVLLQMGQNTMC